MLISSRSRGRILGATEDRLSIHIRLDRNMRFIFIEANKNMTNSNIEKKRILLVEDDEDSQELVPLILTDYEIVIARNFTEGLRLARKMYFDLFILDNWLPDGNGVELCRRIRKFDPHTPVVFLSSVAFESDVWEALMAGAQIYLTKPSNPDELQRTVARLTFAASSMAYEARPAEIAAVRQ